MIPLLHDLHEISRLSTQYPSGSQGGFIKQLRKRNSLTRKSATQAA